MKSFLANDRIFLRAMEPEDLHIMYEIENDPEFWHISSFTVPYSRYVLKQYIENSANDMFADKQLRLMIVGKADSEVVGTIDITDYVPQHRRGAIGIAVLGKYRGQGYAKDALNLLCEYTFDFLHLRQLYAHIPIDNEASLALFTACGFVQCGILKDWLFTDGTYKDTVLMQCIRV